MNILKIQHLDLKGKKVLVRVDFNIPLTPLDDTRIREALPTILAILKQGGAVILMSHLGRPKGKDPQLSLKPCAKVLSDLLHLPVLMAPDCVGQETEHIASVLQPGQILLLENLRFYPAEEDPATDPTFAKRLASLGDVYVNDAFGTAHRAHSSTAYITQYFPRAAAAGLLMQKEISILETLITAPKHPFFAIIGGSKISTKIGVLHGLLNKVNALFIGGAMAFTFLKAQGIEIGRSVCEPDQLAHAERFALDCANKHIPLYLPTDCVITQTITPNPSYQTISISNGIPSDFQGVDIGPHTIDAWAQVLKQAATVFWNGPLGVFECPPFDTGTQQNATLLSGVQATTIVGGGDSIAAIHQLHLADKFSHLSTGGGAVLEYLEFGHLPGIDALHAILY